MSDKDHQETQQPQPLGPQQPQTAQPHQLPPPCSRPPPQWLTPSRSWPGFPPYWPEQHYPPQHYPPISPMYGFWVPQVVGNQGGKGDKREEVGSSGDDREVGSTNVRS